MTLADVLSGEARHHVVCCRAEELEERLPDGSVSLILTDPPFHKVKDLAWDREHKTASGFLDWIGERFRAWRRILAPNGSLYVFASPAMAWGVEGRVREHFEVLTNIRWAKPQGRANACEKEALRCFFPDSEAVIFAEQKGSDSIALGESQYGAKCDELRGFVFEPLRAYLDGERQRAGLTRKDIDAAWQRLKGNKGGMSSHWFSRSQWALPTRESYEWLRALFNASGGGGALRKDYHLLAQDYRVLRREYEDLRAQYEDLRAQYEDLRAQYEDLRAQYEDLRRPFSVSSEVPYTDVWTYPTVQAYPGKHPCEKPPKMALDIVRASSREGGLVADFFSGSGVFAAAAVALGRRAIACDMDPHWVGVTSERCARAEETGDVARVSRPAKPPPSGPREALQLDLFAPRAA